MQRCTVDGAASSSDGIVLPVDELPALVLPMGKNPSPCWLPLQFPHKTRSRLACNFLVTFLPTFITFPKKCYSPTNNKHNISFIKVSERLSMNSGWNFLFKIVLI